MRTDTWELTAMRGRALVEEAACRSGGPPEGWLRSAARWLAEVAPAWEDMTGALPATRSYRRICASVGLEAWIIAWPPGGRLELHDHGGAGGALQVVRGALVEERVVVGPPAADGTRLLCAPTQRRTMAAGEATAFGPDDVHDVACTGGPPATSVHVYGPAQRPMAFYAVRGAVLEPLPGATDGADVLEVAPSTGVPASGVPG